MAPPRMINYSSGGLCYQADQAIAQGTQVCLLMPGYAPGRFGPDRYRTYKAGMRWSGALRVGRRRMHAVGVQFLEHSLQARQVPPAHCFLQGKRDGGVVDIL